MKEKLLRLYKNVKKIKTTKAWKLAKHKTFYIYKIAMLIFLPLIIISVFMIFFAPHIAVLLIGGTILSTFFVVSKIIIPMYENKAEDFNEEDE